MRTYRSLFSIQKGVNLIDVNMFDNTKPPKLHKKLTHALYTDDGNILLSLNARVSLPLPQESFFFFLFIEQNQLINASFRAFYFYYEYLFCFFSGKRYVLTRSNGMITRKKYLFHNNRTYIYIL